MMQPLRLFCDVARHRSFSAAAAEHRITQSAASQRISALEKQLGATLIDRSVRPLDLTPAGEAFLQECQYILDRYDRMAQRLSQLNRDISGSVRVSAIYSAGIELLSHLKEAFTREHPRVKVEVQYTRTDEVYESVRHNQCDLGIISYPHVWSEVAVIPLRDEPMAVVCPPGHPLAQRRQVHASELGQWAMASFESTMPVGRAVKKYLRSHGVSPRVVNVFDNIDTLKTAIEATGHYALLPERTVQREREAGRLVVVALDPPLARPMGVIHRRRGGDFSPATQAFVDYLLKHAGPDAATPAAEVKPADLVAASRA